MVEDNEELREIVARLDSLGFPTSLTYELLNVLSGGAKPPDDLQKLVKDLEAQGYTEQLVYDIFLIFNEGTFSELDVKKLVNKFKLIGLNPVIVDEIVNLFNITRNIFRIISIEQSCDEKIQGQCNIVFHVNVTENLLGKVLTFQHKADGGDWISSGELFEEITIGENLFYFDTTTYEEDISLYIRFCDEEETIFTESTPLTIITCFTDEIIAAMNQSKQVCFLEFDFVDEKNFTDLLVVFEKIKNAKNNNLPQSYIFWGNNFPDYSLKHFYFPEASLNPAFKTLPENEVSYNFYELITLLQSTCEIEYKDCFKLENNKGRIEYFIFSYPYGGITALMYFAKSFNCITTIINDGTGKYKIDFLENSDFNKIDLTERVTAIKEKEEKESLLTTFFKLFKGS